MATRSDVANLREGTEPQGSALTEILQRAVLNFRVVAGANINTPIAVADIEVGDELVAVIEFPGPGEAAGQVITSRLAQTSIPTDGNIQVSVATNTSADRRLLVVFADLTGDDQ